MGQAQKSGSVTPNNRKPVNIYSIANHRPQVTEVPTRIK